MKTRYLIGLVVIIALMINLAAAGLPGFQGKGQAQQVAIEKIVPTGEIKIAVKSGEQITQEKSVYSMTTIISLVVAVMGIVAFRRNTHL